jgi:hypothetical protein
MGFRIENKATELLIYDTVEKNINYYPKENLSVIAEAGEVVILDDNEEILRADSTQIDDPSVNGVYDLVTTIKSYLTLEGDNDNISGGFADYNDFATSQPLGAISVTGGGAAVVITNDTLGAYTNTQFLPEGVDRLWDPSTNNFDWSDLKVGDMVDIRLDIIVKTLSSNTGIDVFLHLGTGAGAYSIPFIQEHNFKSSGNHQITSFNSIYIGDTNTLNNGGQFKITADANCSVAVNGWYVRCLRRGIV